MKQNTIVEMKLAWIFFHRILVSDRSPLNDVAAGARYVRSEKFQSNSTYNIHRSLRTYLSLSIQTISIYAYVEHLPFPRTVLIYTLKFAQPMYFKT